MFTNWQKRYQIWSGTTLISGTKRFRTPWAIRYSGIVDIPDVVEKLEVIEIEQEKKYCDECKEVITAKSELALPGADIGLNSTIMICYLWVALCLPFTKIRDYVRTFFGLKISTSGLSRHVIRVAGIMKKEVP